MTLATNRISEYRNNVLKQSQRIITPLIGQLIATFIILAFPIIAACTRCATMLYMFFLREKGSEIHG
jgi:hypothetical protein